METVSRLRFPHSRDLHSKVLDGIPVFVEFNVPLRLKPADPSASV